MLIVPEEHDTGALLAPPRPGTRPSNEKWSRRRKQARPRREAGNPSTLEEQLVGLSLDLDQIRSTPGVATSG